MAKPRIAEAGTAIHGRTDEAKVTMIAVRTNTACPMKGVTKRQNQKRNVGTKTLEARRFTTVFD